MRSPGPARRGNASRHLTRPTRPKGWTPGMERLGRTGARGSETARGEGSARGERAGARGPVGVQTGAGAPGRGRDGRRRGRQGRRGRRGRGPEGPLRGSPRPPAHVDGRPEAGPGLPRGGAGRHAPRRRQGVDGRPAAGRGATRGGREGRGPSERRPVSDGSRRPPSPTSAVPTTPSPFCRLSSGRRPGRRGPGAESGASRLGWSIPVAGGRRGGRARDATGARGLRGGATGKGVGLKTAEAARTGAPGAGAWGRGRGRGRGRRGEGGGRSGQGP